jgi:hypothetical protein
MAENTNTSATAGISSAYGTETTSADTTTTDTTVNTTETSSNTSSSTSASTGDSFLDMFMSFLEEALKKLDEYYANHPYGRFLPHKPVDKKAEKETEKTTKAKTKEEKKAEKEAKKAAKKAEKEAKKAAKKAEKEAKKAAKKAAKEAKKAEKKAAKEAKNSKTTTVNTAAENTQNVQTIEATPFTAAQTIDKSSLKLDLTNMTQANYPTTEKVTTSVEKANTVSLEGSNDYVAQGQINSTGPISTKVATKSDAALDLAADTKSGLVLQTTTDYPTDDKVHMALYHSNDVELSASEQYLATYGKEITITKIPEKTEEENKTLSTLSPAMLMKLNERGG